MGKTERVVVWIFAALAAAAALATLGTAALRLRLYIVASGGGETPVALLTERPVDGAHGGTTPEIITGIHPTADLLVRGLTDGTVALLAVGEGLGALVGIVVAAGIAALCVSIARGRPFVRSLYAVALIAGATLSIGSLLAQGIAGFGRMNAATELNAVTGDAFVVGFMFDPAPIAIGAVVMVLSYLFRAGSRLQRETEGLV